MCATGGVVMGTDGKDRGTPGPADLGASWAVASAPGRRGRLRAGHPEPQEADAADEGRCLARPASASWGGNNGFTPVPTSIPLVDQLVRSRYLGGGACLLAAGLAAGLPLPPGAGPALLLASASAVAIGAWRRHLGTSLMGRDPATVPGLSDPGGWALATHRGIADDVGLAPLGRTRWGRPVWLPASAVREPMLVVGPDAARADVLLDLARAALATGSGFAHVDDGRNPGRIEDYLGIAQACGREADAIVLDLCRPGLRGPGGSHSYNPLRAATPAGMHRLLREVLSRGRGRRAAHWDERSDLLLLAAVALAAGRRDGAGVPVTLDGLRALLPLKALWQIDANRCDDGHGPGQAEVVRAYLRTLPGYDRHRQAQSAEVRENHAAVMSGLDAGLAFLSVRLGACLEGPGSDVDMADVLENRRILLVRLPGGTSDDDEARFVARYVLGGLLGEAAAFRERPRPSWGSPLYPVMLDGVEGLLGRNLRDWTKPLDGEAMVVHSVAPGSHAWQGPAAGHLASCPTVVLAGGGFGGLSPVPALADIGDAVVRGGPHRPPRAAAGPRPAGVREGIRPRDAGDAPAGHRRGRRRPPSRQPRAGGERRPGIGRPGLGLRAPRQAPQDRSGHGPRRVPRGRPGFGPSFGAEDDLDLDFGAFGPPEAADPFEFDFDMRPRPGRARKE